MADDSAARRRKLVAQISDHLERAADGSGDPDPVLCDLATACFGRAPEDVFSRRAPADLAGLVESLRAIAESTGDGLPALRLFNPNPDRDGWSSPHTVLQIVNDDMPFLVDSVTGTLTQADLRVHVVLHPVLWISQDASGRITEVSHAEAPSAGARRLSLMHVEIDRQSSTDVLDQLTQDLRAVLADVRAAVDDWQTMRNKVDEAITGLKSVHLPTAEGEGPEVIAFLRWLRDNQFTFLGYREYSLTAPLTPGRVGPNAGDSTLEVVCGSGLGVLRDDAVLVFDGLRHRDMVSEQARPVIAQPEALLITKCSRRSTVHRMVPMDGIMVRQFDPNGNVVGLLLFVGLFTSAAYALTASDIPLLRRKVRHVIDRAGFPANGHAAKALVHILNTYPRDELFQVDIDKLTDSALRILDLQERPRTALILRRDQLGRFFTALVFIARDAYATDSRMRLQTALEARLNAQTTAFYTTLDDSPLARVMFILRVERDALPEVDDAALEAELAELSRQWGDRLLDRLVDSMGEEAGIAMWNRYAHAFSAGYRERFPAREAVTDIADLERSAAKGHLGIRLYRPDGADPTAIRLKLFSGGTQLTLATLMPLLQDMGLRVLAELPFAVRPGEAGSAYTTYWVHDIEAQIAPLDDDALEEIRPRFEEALDRVWLGTIECDPANALVLNAGLTWREVGLMRAYIRFLKQIRFSYEQSFIEATLNAHPMLTRTLVGLFHHLHDPDRDRDAAAQEADSHSQAIEEALEAIASLDEDRVLRTIYGCILATLRTNYYQRDDQGEPPATLALKFNSTAVPDLPDPRPYREIFVYSPRVEGIHLRGGPIARGGLRWSDRHQDFRSEILDLMKSQMVKNAVIVPVGAKGGFVVKKPPEGGDRDAMQQEGIACYRRFIGALLDVTDNLEDRDGATVTLPPPRVVRRDDDDPYLVVAADKGTATFSDIANEISQERGFWMDDAFASGGSAGYDHKAMGITARGAWEGVKRHFREMGKDIQTEPFTVIGIGDMSGDVFGNGMLLSEQIKLIGAFNHLHIFCDPDPDPAKSFKERQRLFALPRSNWADYDAAVLSAGGRIYSRADKSLALTPEIKAAFGLSQDQVSPNTLLRAMLTAEAELLWFGGIGTYVKAKEESHGDVLDKANDAIRVDGHELRVQVIGEGANLGVTQRGRIAFAAQGGRINTDFIDNSAGVDCSDHEVNIKILLSAEVAAGRLDLADRNALLEEMTEDVAALVLRDNYDQTQALSVAEASGTRGLESAARSIRALERRALLNRSLEALPDDTALRRRAADGLGLTRPEYAILLAYAKIDVYDQLLASDLPDDPGLSQDLVAYFPAAMRARYAEMMPRHRLARDIVATVVTNSLVNRCGPNFVREAGNRSGFTAVEVTRAFLITREVMDLPALWQGIEALDGKASAETQIRLLRAIQDFITQAVGWLLTYGEHPLRLTETTAALCPAITELRAGLSDLLPQRRQQEIAAQVETYGAAGVPEPLGRAIASLRPLFPVFEIARIGRACGMKVTTAADAFFQVGERTGLAALRGQIRDTAIEAYWDREATEALTNDYYAHQADLTRRILTETEPKDMPSRIEAWSSQHAEAMAQLDTLVREARREGGVSLALLTLINRRARLLLAA